MLLDLTASPNLAQWIVLKPEVDENVPTDIPNYGQMACLQYLTKGDTFGVLLFGGVDQNNTMSRSIYKLEITFSKEDSEVIK